MLVSASECLRNRERQQIVLNLTSLRPFWHSSPYFHLFQTDSNRGEETFSQIHLVVSNILLGRLEDHEKDQSVVRAAHDRVLAD